MKTLFTSHRGSLDLELPWQSNGLRWAEVRRFILLGWSLGFITTLVTRLLIG